MVNYLIAHLAEIPDEILESVLVSRNITANWTRKLCLRIKIKRYTDKRLQKATQFGGQFGQNPRNMFNSICRLTVFSSEDYLGTLILAVNELWMGRSSSIHVILIDNPDILFRKKRRP